MGSVTQAVQREAVKRRRAWPLFLMGLPAAAAVWSGWVGLGALCGFGIIHPLPGIVDSLQLNTAITLPVGVEAYGGYALGVWADAATPARVRRFAFRSALGSLCLGLLGQVAFHLLSAAGYTHAPWPVVVFVSCIPVAALGFGMGLHQLLIHADADEPEPGMAATSPAAMLDALARTATRRVPEPERWPSGPAPRSEAERHDGIYVPEADEPEVVRPVPPADEIAPGSLEVVHPEQDRRPVLPLDEIDREAAEVFGSSPAAGPAPARPRPAARARPAAAEWTPASVGRTEDEVRELTRTLTRNKLAETLPCSRGTADKLRARYARPEMAGR